ncbi:adenosylcobinamide-GDP ribazoletransferase [Oceanobacillus sp. Castelsardo]|uniref:adenosylcobinamide-GDP ribazoletransferase n=1 Tax=Oceanobacillus sp. Castelsardo TaxID=1851204 RepID=UPI000838D33B|nr:adenosylcobinamide-GDP ribazoletransferase [Oceanobacillus sp. Castelsardo]
MRNFITGFLITIQFLTALPIKKSLPMGKDYIEKSIQSFPLLGLLQGTFYSILLYILLEWTPFSTLAIAFIIWLATILITGGIHLDGWMDMSDAYFSYQDKEKRLEIMKDPRAGAFGVMSLLVLLSSRFLFIYEVIQFPTIVTFLVIVLIPFLSKVVMGMVLLHIPAAKKEGLASFFQNAAKKTTLYIYPVYLIIIVALISMIDFHFIFLALLFVLIALVCYLLIRRKSVKHFGGITGDILGASGEGTENILWMTLWLLHYFAMV